MSTRTRLIKLAYEKPELRAKILPILVAGDKAKTEEGAKNLHKKYMEKHPDSKKKPQDFFEEGDSEGGGGEEGGSNEAPTAKGLTGALKSIKKKIKTAFFGALEKGSGKILEGADAGMKKLGGFELLEKNKFDAGVKVLLGMGTLAGGIAGGVYLAPVAAGLAATLGMGSGAAGGVAAAALGIKGWGMGFGMGATAGMIGTGVGTFVPMAATSKFHDWAMGKRKDAEGKTAAEGGKMPDDVKQELLDYYTEVSDQEAKLIEKFVDPKTGKFDEKGLEEHMTKEAWKGQEKAVKKAKLRRDTIKLAYARPDLRPKLLPLIKQAGEKTAGNLERDIVHLLLKLDKGVHLDFLNDKFRHRGPRGEDAEEALETLKDEGLIEWTRSDMIHLKNPSKAQREYGKPRSATKTATKFAAKHPLDGVRKHQLMPNNIARKIPKLYTQEDVEDPTVWVKFFSPYGRGVWYVTEFDGRDRMFGWADLGHGELGYMSLNELQSMNRNGLPLVERDLSWKPMPLSKAKGR